MGSQLGELCSLAAELTQEGGHGLMQLLDLQPVGSVPMRRRAHALDLQKWGLINGGVARQGKLEHVLRPELGDELTRRSEGDAFAVVDDCDAVAQPFGFFHSSES